MKALAALPTRKVLKRKRKMGWLCCWFSCIPFCKRKMHTTNNHVLFDIQRRVMFLCLTLAKAPEQGATAEERKTNWDARRIGIITILNAFHQSRRTKDHKLRPFIAYVAKLIFNRTREHHPQLHRDATTLQNTTLARLITSEHQTVPLESSRKLERGASTFSIGSSSSRSITKSQRRVTVVDHGVTRLPSNLVDVTPPPDDVTTIMLQQYGEYDQAQAGEGKSSPVSGMGH